MDPTSPCDERGRCSALRPGARALLAGLVAAVAFSTAALAEAPVPMTIPWARLENPVYQRDDWSVKDATMVERDGWFYLFFSAFFFDRGQERCHVSGVRTRDFLDFSEPLFVWDGRESGWTGLCSPNVTVTADGYVLTYNSWGDVHPNGGTNQLFYATSSDLEHWTRDLPLATNLTDGTRAIDAAVAFEGDQVHLLWKEGQLPLVAVAGQLGADGWERLGTPMVDGAFQLFENGEFLRVDGRWHLLVTGLFDHEPYLTRMVADGSEPSHWLEWTGWQLLEVEVEAFNTDERANAAFLADWRHLDGHFYLVYAGRTEGRSHAGRGDNKLGLSRSRDVTFAPEPGPDALAVAAAGGLATLAGRRKLLARTPS